MNSMVRRVLDSLVRVRSVVRDDDPVALSEDQQTALQTLAHYLEHADTIEENLRLRTAQAMQRMQVDDTLNQLRHSSEG